MLVAFTFCNHDKELAIKNLEWMREIKAGTGHEILLVASLGVPIAWAEKAQKISEDTFDNVTLLHLVDDCTTGWPFGPNFMFRRTVDYIDYYKLYPFMLLESDAWLLAADSLDRIEGEWNDCHARGKQFMGYKEMEGKSGEHMNGVGVYNNINQYAPSLLSAPWPQELSEITANKMAFDMAGAVEVVPLMHNSRLFQFQYKQEERLLKDASLSFLNPDAAVFHTEKTGKLVDLLRIKQRKADGKSDYQNTPTVMVSDSADGRGLLLAQRNGICTDIFIKTYDADKQWHEKCLQSIKRYGRDFRTVVENHETAPWSGYLHQQSVKLNSDRYTDADFILVTDSDTLFTREVSPSSFMRGTKSIWYYAPREEVLAADSGTSKWFDCMRDFIGIDPEHEFMRRQPFFVPRWLLQSLRQFCILKHGITVEEYIKKQQHFSEWNVLGFFAYTFHREAFEWLKDGPVYCRQFWSPHNVGEAKRQQLFDDALPEIKAILGEDEPIREEKVELTPIQKQNSVVAGRIQVSDGWDAIPGEPQARMSLAEKVVAASVATTSPEDKKQAMLDRMAKARAARKVKTK